MADTAYSGILISGCMSAGYFKGLGDNKIILADSLNGYRGGSLEVVVFGSDGVVCRGYSRAVYDIRYDTRALSLRRLLSPLCV